MAANNTDTKAADLGGITNGPNLVQTNASNIWQTMVKTVRDVDMQKVADTKEDLDTLLVFAGLFSAVVTTFVVASYPNLQPDNTDEIVFLLRQSLAQSYTFDGGSLTPTTPFPTDPQFEVPLWALRVNGLWFASLIVSLSTASFGMLVKQWLTEYLAMEQWISPKEQLRARQYRRPAVEAWKVFEIAAILPLFLHISLGLFFIGLCLYTAAANEIIGRSTFPLVAGWAFCAVMTTFAPIVSPRCPYKVTLLKTTLRMARRYVTSRLWQPMSWLGHIVLSTVKWTWNYVLLLPFRAFDAFVTGFWMLVQAARDVFIVLGFIVFLFYAPFGLIKTTFTLLSRVSRAVIADPQTDEDEEEDVMKQRYTPHELLLDVDVLMVDDGPILETMSEVLKQTRTSPQNVLAFVLGCIQHRIGTADAALWIPDIYGGLQGRLDLSVLSESAWDLLITLVAETWSAHLPIAARLNKSRTDSPNDWAGTAVMVLFSDSRWPLPGSVRDMVSDRPTLSTMLQHVRLRVRDWPLRNVLDLLWTAFTASERNPEGSAANVGRDWSLFIQSRSDSTVDHAQKAAIQILLQSTWRDFRPDEQVADQHEKNFAHCRAEATMMLFVFLRATLPGGETEERRKRSISSFDEYRAIPNIESALYSLPLHYSSIATQLLEAVGDSSPARFSTALDLYKAFITRSPIDSPSARIPLWRFLHENRQILRDVSLRPVLLDLWRFLLKRARPVGTTKPHRRPPLDFVKLCIVLVQPNVPLIFGRSESQAVRDWLELAPMLEQGPGDDAPADGSGFFRTREGSISALAKDALERLDNRVAFSIPEDLVTVLTWLKEGKKTANMATNVTANASPERARTGLGATLGVTVDSIIQRLTLFRKLTTMREDEDPEAGDMSGSALADSLQSSPDDDEGPSASETASQDPSRSRVDVSAGLRRRGRAATVPARLSSPHAYGVYSDSATPTTPATPQDAGPRTDARSPSVPPAPDRRARTLPANALHPRDTGEPGISGSRQEAPGTQPSGQGFFGPFVPLVASPVQTEFLSSSLTQALFHATPPASISASHFPGVRVTPAAPLGSTSHRTSHGGPPAPPSMARSYSSSIDAGAQLAAASRRSHTTPQDAGPRADPRPPSVPSEPDRRAKTLPADALHSRDTGEPGTAGSRQETPGTRRSSQDFVGSVTGTPLVTSPVQTESLLSRTRALFHTTPPASIPASHPHSIRVMAPTPLGSISRRTSNGAPPAPPVPPVIHSRSGSIDAGIRSAMASRHSSSSRNATVPPVVLRRQSNDDPGAAVRSATSPALVQRTSVESRARRPSQGSVRIVLPSNTSVLHRTDSASARDREQQAFPPHGATL